MVFHFLGIIPLQDTERGSSLFDGCILIYCRMGPSFIGREFIEASPYGWRLRLLRWGFRERLMALRKGDTVPVSAALQPRSPSMGSEFPVPGPVPASAEGPQGILAMK